MPDISQGVPNVQFYIIFIMKKFIVAVCFLLSVVAASGQSKLIYQHHDAKSGLRSFGTSDLIVRNGMTDAHPFKVSILAVETPTGWSYSLNIAVSEFTSRAVPEGSMLLLRAKSGEVFEFANTLNEFQSRDLVGQRMEGVARRIFYNKASYMITREHLETLSSGVLKLRMQLSGEVFDTEYKRDRLGAAIKAHLDSIDSGMSMGSDLKSNF